jgi:hypothetical protein
LSFANEATTSRIRLMNSSAIGLSVRCFNVTIPIRLASWANLTGRILMESRFEVSRMRDRSAGDRRVVAEGADADEGPRCLVGLGYEYAFTNNISPSLWRRAHFNLRPPVGSCRSRTRVVKRHPEGSW